METRLLFLISGLYWGDNNKIVKGNQNEKCCKGRMGRSWPGQAPVTSTLIKLILILVTRGSGGINHDKMQEEEQV